MLQIMPVSELRNNFTEISRIVHETSEPIFLTKNGYGDMVIMSINAYKEKLSEQVLYIKLKEAETEALTTNIRLDFDEVSKEMRELLVETIQNKNASIGKN